jgi:hypothetical protein
MLRFLFLSYLIQAKSALLLRLCASALRGRILACYLYSACLLKAITISNHYSLRMPSYDGHRRCYNSYRNEACVQAALDIATYLLLSGLYLDHLASTLREDLGVILGKLSAADPALQGRQSKLNFTPLGNEPKITTLHLLTALRL